MKKYILYLLASLLVLVGCSSQSSEKTKPSKVSSTTEVVEKTTEVVATTEAAVEKVEAYQYEETTEGFKQTIKENWYTRAINLPVSNCISRRNQMRPLKPV